MKNKKGFTLIEMLIVIVIMGILTTITVAQFMTAQRKARDVQRKGDISALGKALEMYYTDYGEFPRSSLGEIQLISGEIIHWGGVFEDDGYTYMATVPTENRINNPPYQYCYVVSADQKMYGLFSNLENNQDSDYNKLNNGNPYNFCGHDYNFAIISPNARLSDL